MLYQDDGSRRRKRWSEWSPQAKVGVIAAAIVLAPAFFALFASITMWLWNWLMPGIFKLPAIGFWQAVGILLLSHILFKGSCLSRAGRSRWKKGNAPDQMSEAGPQASAPLHP